MDDALSLKKHFNARGDGETDDTRAIRAWLREGIETGLPLYTGAGHFRARKPIRADVNRCADRGVLIYGAGLRRSVFELATIDSASEAPFLIHCSKQQGKDIADAFYWQIRDIGLVGRRNGPVLQVGYKNFSDAHNSFDIVGVGVNNDHILKDGERDRVVALQLNFTCQGEIKVVANCGQQGDNLADVKDRRRAGAALELRQAQFARIYGSYSNAQHGIRLVDGYTYGNHFDTVNVEEAGTCIVIDTDTARNNKFTTGTFVGNNGLDFRRGENNAVEAPNVALYEGGEWIVNSVGLLESLALPGLPMPSHRQGAGRRQLAR